MKKVMIVDDAMFMRNSIRMILNSEGYNVIAEAENGKEAVQKHKKLELDIITMDITMPQMNGIEALKRIRSMNQTVKIVLISSIGQYPLIQEAMVNGANDFIVKPFKKEEVLEVLNSL